MPYFKPFLSLLFIAGLLITVASCGTAKRLTKRKNTNKETKPLTEKIELNADIAIKAKKVRATISRAELTALKLIEEGTASWYGSKFHGNLTASGEVYNMHELTAAHRTLPFGTIVLVKNMNNGESVAVRINDRGPYVGNRIIDLSKKAARKIGMISTGTAHVRLYTLKEALPEAVIENIKVPTFTVQLGSYKTESQAYEHASRIKSTRVEVAFVGNSKVFRVYYGLFIHKDKAQKALKELKNRGIEGYVKQVENG